MKWASHKHSNVYGGATVIASEFILMHMINPPNLALSDCFGTPDTSTLFQKKSAQPLLNNPFKRVARECCGGKSLNVSGFNLNYNVLCLRIFNAPVLGFLRRQLAELLVAGGRLLVLLGVVVAVSQGG